MTDKRDEGLRLLRGPIDDAEAEAVAEIFAYDTGLTHLPHDIERFRNVRVLDLATNTLTRIPRTIAKLHQLAFLYLHENHLTDLPPLPPNVRYLNVNRNGFTIFPSVARSLVEVRAESNRITTIPPQVGHMENLRELHLRGNGIDAVPDELCNATNLRVLNLRENRMTALPQAIGKLAHLLYLDLRGNDLRTLPDAVAELPRLEKLDLRWNHNLRADGWVDALRGRGVLVYL